MLLCYADSTISLLSWVKFPVFEAICWSNSKEPHEELTTQVLPKPHVFRHYKKHSKKILRVKSYPFNGTHFVLILVLVPF